VITIQTIRAAIAAADPYSEMDRVVRAELTAGRLVKDVFEDIRPHVQDVLDTPSLSEDGEEAFLGTLDALAGFCRADQVYRNPPVLPTEDEIGQRPRWAQLAFTARCARRVLPLFTRLEDLVPAEKRDVVLKTLSLAEGAARMGDKSLLGKLSTQTTEVWLDLHGRAKHAVQCVFSAAYMAKYGLNAKGRKETVFHGLAAASEALMGNNAPIRRDFDLLARLVSAYGWTDDTPVPPEVFGPLWPEGKPAGWWPDDPESPKRNDFALETVSSERVTDAMIEDEVVNLFLAMNRFHIARTGQSLTVEDFQPYLAALVPAGV